MANLHYTIGDIKFMNFVSNQYPNGIPPSSISNHTEDLDIKEWVSNYAYPGSSSISAAYTYLYMPSVIGTPTENESKTGPATSSNYRLELYYNKKYSISFQNPVKHKLNTSDTGITTFYSTSRYTYLHNTDISSYNNVFTYGVASPSTLVLFEFICDTISNPIDIRSPIKTNMEIFGWSHNSIYPSPYTDALYRFNNFYALSSGGDPYSSTLSELGYSPRQAESNLNDSLCFTYYDIECLNGNYSPGLFLTDFLIRKFDENNFYPIVGKVDNRVVCIGRGPFEIGKVYRSTNVFGRTGVEDWICVKRIVPSSYNISDWNYSDIANYRGDEFRYWKNDSEFDYMLARVYTIDD